MNLEQRVRRLEDIEAVRDTWHQYMISLDSGDRDAFADVFAEDAIVEVVGLDSGDGRYVGRDAVLQHLYNGTMTVGPPGGFSVNAEGGLVAVTGHHGTNLRVSLGNDGRADTVAYFFQIANTLALAGTYRHRMRREPDRWRIAYLEVHVKYRSQLAVVEPRTFQIVHPGPTAGSVDAGGPKTL